MSDIRTSVPSYISGVGLQGVILSLYTTVNDGFGSGTVG